MRPRFSLRVCSVTTILVLVLIGLSAGVASGCGKKDAAAAGQAKVMNATRSGLQSYMGIGMAGLKGTAIPSFVPSDIRDAYQFALQRPDVLQYIPCYCGCGMHSNHKSNLNCYIDGVQPDGTVQWDVHATQCYVCVEITRDAKQLQGREVPLKDIRTYIDNTHGKKGPGTDTPFPPA